MAFVIHSYLIWIEYSHLPVQYSLFPEINHYLLTLRPDWLVVLSSKSAVLEDDVLEVNCCWDNAWVNIWMIAGFWFDMFSISLSKSAACSASVLQDLLKIVQEKKSAGNLRTEISIQRVAKFEIFDNFLYNLTSVIKPFKYVLNIIYSFDPDIFKHNPLIASWDISRWNFIVMSSIDFIDDKLDSMNLELFFCPYLS